MMLNAYLVMFNGQIHGAYVKIDKAKAAANNLIRGLAKGPVTDFQGDDIILKIPSVTIRIKHVKVEEE